MIFFCRKKKNKNEFSIAGNCPFRISISFLVLFSFSDNRIEYIFSSLLEFVIFDWRFYYYYWMRWTIESGLIECYIALRINKTNMGMWFSLFFYFFSLQVQIKSISNSILFLSLHLKHEIKDAISFELLYLLVFVFAELWSVFKF